jgi:hypothetical protein
VIKVEMLEDSKTGIRTFFFESNRPDDANEKESLDKILASLVAPTAKRGSYVLGSPGVLKIEVKIQE